ncbi:MAG: hypothetical protein IT378_26770 [Sandaracinaceae bacterium]|nr:hypothetical protein [Sandaracinaceae bacterium]
MTRRGLLCAALLLAGGCGLFQTGAVTQNANPLGVDVRARQCAHLGQVTIEQLREMSASPAVQSGFIVQNSSPLFVGSRADQMATLSQRTSRIQVQIVGYPPRATPPAAPADGGVARPTGGDEPRGNEPRGSGP